MLIAIPRRELPAQNQDMVSGLTFAILDGRGRVLAQGPGGAIVSAPGIVDQEAQRRAVPAEEGTAQPELGMQAVPEVAAEEAEAPAEAVPEAMVEEGAAPAEAVPEAAVEEGAAPEIAAEEAEVPAEAAVKEAAAPAGRGAALAWLVVWVLLVAAIVAGTVVVIRRYIRQD
jgi:hypothetical protein